MTLNDVVMLVIMINYMALETNFISIISCIILLNNCVTFDTNILYTNPYIEKGKIKDSECVMEIKVPFDCDDDYIEQYIPYSTARFRNILVVYYICQGK